MEELNSFPFLRVSRISGQQNHSKVHFIVINLICHHVKLFLFYYKTWKNIIKAIESLYLGETVLSFIVKLTFCLLRPLLVSGTSQPFSWFLIPWEYIYRNILLNLSWDVDDLCLGFNLAQIPSYRATGKKAGQCSLTAPQHCGELPPLLSRTIPAWGNDDNSSSLSRNKAW